MTRRLFPLLRVFLLYPISKLRRRAAPPPPPSCPGWLPRALRPSLRRSAALRSLSRSGRRRRRSPLPSPVLYSSVFTDFDFLVRIRVLFDIRLLSWTDSIDDLAFFSPFFPYPAALRRHLSPSRRPAGHVLARARSTFHPLLCHRSGSLLPPPPRPRPPVRP